MIGFIDGMPGIDDQLGLFTYKIPIKAVMVGEELRCQAWVQERTGKREAIIKAALYNADDEICAESNGIFTMLSLALARRIKMTDAAFEKTFYDPIMACKRQAGADSADAMNGWWDRIAELTR